MYSELLSGAIGAALAAIAALFVQHSSNQTSHKALIEEHQIQEYLSALDCSFDALQALEAMGRALSGRTEPGPNASQEEIDESKERDEASANALGDLFTALRALNRQAYRIQAIGSRKVKMTAKDFCKSADQYLQNAFEQMLEDGRFIAADHTLATKQLKARIEKLSDAVREDLQIDDLFKKDS